MMDVARCDFINWFALGLFGSPDLQIMVGAIFYIWSQDLPCKEYVALPFMFWKHGPVYWEQ